MKKGDIVLVPFPFTDLSGIKTRPGLILVSNEFDITLAFITSQLKWIEDFDVRIDASETSGLKKPSLIRLSKLATIDKDLIIGRIGSISTQDLSEVEKNLIKIFQIDPTQFNITNAPQ